MAKFVLFSDFHSHNYQKNNRPNLQRLDFGLEMLEKEIYGYAHSIGANGLFFCGDWFDSPKLLPTIVVNRNTETVLKLSRQYPNLPVLAISGNHDHSSKNLLHKPAVTALTYLQEIAPANFRIIDDQTMKVSEDMVVTGIPYYEFKEDFHTRLREQHEIIKARIENGTLSRDSYKVLLIHQTPSGLPNPNIPVDTDVNDPLYDIWDEVFCGHIHARQEITPKFTLLGNTDHRDLGDEGSEKGIYVIDSVTRTKQFVSLKGKYPEYRRVRVKIGEAVPDDGFNWYVPHYVTDEINNNPDAAINTDNFEVDLSAETLIDNYCKEVAPGNQRLLSAGLECLKLKVEI